MGRFTIAGDNSTPQPHDIQHPPRQPVGYRPDGVPVYQGREQIVAVYRIITPADLAILFGHYRPGAATVTITYDEPRAGGNLSCTAEMQQPQVGRQEGMLFYDVQVAFTGLRLPDTTPPVVASTYPSDGATEVAVSSGPTVSFNEALDEATVTALNVYITDALDVTVPASVTYNSATRTISLEPLAPLASSATYTLHVTTGVTDVAGNHLASERTVSFTTAAPDTQAPSVLSVDPSDGATGVSVAKTVGVVFSEAMDASTLTGASLFLRDPDGNTVPAVVTYSAASHTASVNPSTNLNNSTQYQLNVTAACKDAAGNAFAGATYAFTTAAAATNGTIFGVNISGPEYGTPRWPSLAMLNYWRDLGVTFVRLCILWSHIQPTLTSGLDALDGTYLGDLESVLAYCDGNNIRVLLDSHDYGRRGGASIAGGGISDSQFANYWLTLVTALQGHVCITGWGLTNEANTFPEGAAGWKDAAQAAIDAIRTVDMDRDIYVGGYEWSGTLWWLSNGNGVLADLTDPAGSGHLVMEGHAYADDLPGGGKYESTYDAELAADSGLADRCQNWTKDWIAWCNTNGFRAFLGEYGVPHTRSISNLAEEPRWYNTVLANALAWLDGRVYGATMWCAGEGVSEEPGDWSRLEPDSYSPVAGERPQVAILKSYL